MSDDVDGDLWFRLLNAVGKARHPDLSLWRFVADADLLPEDDQISEDDVPDHEREAAELRRAALVVAAVEIVDRCIDDLQLIEFGDDQWPDAEDAEDSFVYEWFPGRHRKAYDETFFRKVMVTAVQVAADLADLEGGPASCTAEEIVRHAVGVIAGEFCEAVGLGRPWLDPDEYLLEDADFEFLYGKDMDGLEDDPGMQAALGIDVSPLEWEPHDGADSIRAEPVVVLTAHRHFPVGDDEPWVHAAVGGGRFLAIPLRFVVSYRPDPEIRERWERMFSSLLP